MNVSFSICGGEILGVAGVTGNGQTELAEALSGLRPSLSGTVILDGKDVTHASPGRLYERGTGHIPEDRLRRGLVEAYSIAENLVLNSFKNPPFSGALTLRRRVIRDHAHRLIQDYDIRPADPETIVETLSGGNQQKTVVAREFSRPLRLLLAVQPTRGLDVGSAAFIHRKIREQREAGCAVLLISTELDEIFALSDRIIVLYRGRIVKETTPDIDRETLGLSMAGAGGNALLC